jgi:hypothetical protein
MGCRRARTLDRRFRPASHLNQHFQRFDDGLLADVAPPDRAEPLFMMHDAPVARRDREVNEPDRLARRGTARSRDSSDGHREIDIGMFERAEGHRNGDFLADRTEGVELCGLDAKHGVLGLVGIGDEAAVDHVGGAGYFRQRGGDKAAGAGFRRGDLELTHPAEIEEGAGQRPCGAVAHVSGSRPYQIHPPRAGGRSLRPSPQYLPGGR